jgi:hypothetical protein
MKSALKPDASGEIVLDVSGLTGGLYLVCVEMEAGVVVGRVVKL